MVEKSTILLMVTALKLVNSYDQKTCDVKYSGEKQIVYDISCQESNVSNICCFLTSSDKPEKFFWGDCNERNNYLLIDIVAKSVADGCSVRLCSKVNQKESVEFSIYAYQNDNGTQEHIFTSQPFHIYSRHCKMKHQMGDRFERATNITIVGNPSQTFKNVPFEVTCRKKCQITNCLYYSWNYKDFACNTFNSDENVIGFCPLIGWISLHYEDSEDDEACTTQITFDDQCLAHNFSIKASGESHQNITDFSQCSKKCSHNCSYFAWNPLLSDCTTFSNDSVLEFCSTTTTEDSLVIGCNKEILLNAAGLNILYASVSMAMVAIIIWIIYKIYQRSTSASHDIIQMRSNNSVKRQRSILEMKSLTRVRLEDFAAMHMANLIPKKEEFDYLATIHVRHHILQFSTEVAALYPDRNRYKNVVPYDYNRVKLIQRMHDSDYINASWIRGHREIAAQGPLPNTVEHFLQMVVEQKVEAIVMLTSTTEQKRDGTTAPKCEQYWPDHPGESRTFGHIEIANLNSQENSNGVVMRHLCIQDLASNEMQNVSMLHYLNWPDFKVPADAKDLFDVVESLKLLNPARIIVHCSAGVGRTGTFIALTRLVDQVDGQVQFMDVFDTVLGLRRDRKFMVQKPEQYRFLYSAIATYIKMKSDV